ncbi:alpha/beta fold hydrolase [Bacillus sp. DX4.1]|uniref:alpha/beta hydrolase n=1 Tax=Bacillus sp. DX4.1 TaxID=3055867 RepID=UPI0025A0DD71|nr:alpha/beta hydrolase [Bacillus sp. DX4.1]MDM5187566.1 alpha/beta fold hydrolase [Bacillus sp. DX4.1]
MEFCYLIEINLIKRVGINMKCRKKIISLFVLLVIIYNVRYSSYGEIDLPKRSKVIVKQPPVILIHGFSGGEGTFTEFINKLEVDGYASLTDKYLVRENGHIDFKLSSYSESPLVQVIFEHNYKGSKTQLNWLKDVIRIVKYKYQTEKVILIGHSMGGLVATSYILETGGNDVEKLITLATPIIGTEKIPQSFSKGAAAFFIPALIPALGNLYVGNAQEYIRERKELFNKNVQVFSVAGIITWYDFSTGEFIDVPDDGVVDIKSQLFLSKLTKNFKGEACMCFHTNVQKNERIIEEIEKFIWKN